MKLMLKRFTLLAIMVLLGTQTLNARSFRVAQLPNGSINGCANCHVNPNGGGARNAFGALVGASFLDGGNVVWNDELASQDSDGDGFSNGHELEDPFGMWSSGGAAPGEASLVSNPGEAASAPQGVAEAMSLYINFINFTVHMGDLFQVRVEVSSTGEQVAFGELASIPGASFEFSFPHALDRGESYDIEFWTDYNQNGIYDPPPTDHAWRTTLNEISDNQLATLTHSTNWVDIGSPVSIADDFQAPLTHALFANYPNPFNPTTTLSFSLDQAQEVELNVYDVQGKHVKSLYSGYAQAGQHDILFEARDTDGTELTAGIYFYTLTSKLGISSQRMTLLK
jgi:hypothetical protein